MSQIEKASTAHPEDNDPTSEEFARKTSRMCFLLENGINESPNRQPLFRRRKRIYVSGVGSIDVEG